MRELSNGRHNCTQHEGTAGQPSDREREAKIETERETQREMERETQRERWRQKHRERWREKIGRARGTLRRARQKTSDS